MTSHYQAPLIPQAFIWRKAHSLTGLWLVLFLIEHLFTNSQAALYMGDGGRGFVAAVNWLSSLPYLHEIEILLLAVPFLIHGLWGVRYLMTAKYNSFPTDQTTPSLSSYSRNHAYTWQRITSWVLLFGILAHVIHMRFVNYPEAMERGNSQVFVSRLSNDNQMTSLSKKLNVEIYDHEAMKNETWLNQINPSLANHELIAVSPSFGVAELLIVREAFKNPLMVFLYTGLVLASCFHAFNGLWTFMISWGITLTARSQQIMRSIATCLMVIVSFLGLAAIWGSYWFNL